MTVEIITQEEHAKRLDHIFPEYNLDTNPGTWINMKHTSGDGRSLNIEVDTRKKQYRICVNWPYMNGQHYEPVQSVTSPRISWTKNDPVILNEADRRILEWYNQQYPLMYNQAVADRLREEQRVNKVKALLEYLDVKGEPDLSRETYWPYKYGINQLQISTNRIRIETDYLDHDTATEIIHFIKELTQKKLKEE